MKSSRRLLSALSTNKRAFIGGFRTAMHEQNPDHKPHQGKKEMERRAKKIKKAD